MVKLMKKLVLAAAIAVGAFGGTNAETVEMPGSAPMSTVAVEVSTPRTFSKLKVVVALRAYGVWPRVKEWIIANDLYDLYLAAQDFSEADPYFTQGKAALQALLGLTDEQVEAILAECVVTP